LCFIPIREGPRGEEHRMTISIIIPVLREEALINEAITRIRAMDETVEIVVVDGSPGAETLKAVTGDHAKLVTSGTGRALQMNRGAKIANGDVLLFLHVDTELPQDGLRMISSALSDGRFVGGAFDLKVGEAGFIFRVIGSIASLRSRLTRMPYGDQAIFLRRDYFMKIGGYREITLMEDVDLMRRVKAEAEKICILRERVRTSSRRWNKEGVLRCTLRNWTIMALYLMGVSPERLAKWYRF